MSLHCGKTWREADGEKQCGLAQGHAGVCLADPGLASTADVRSRRTPVYMMHPLGDGANRERNRKLACLWQAEIQRAHPEWLVLAPWIGLSGAWSEEHRAEGMAVQFATIDLCGGGVITGPLDGPMIAHPMNGLRSYEGVSPGMCEELLYFGREHPTKPILDARTLFKVELPADWTPPRVIKPASEFKPRFEKFEQVLVEHKSGGLCHVKDIEETAPGCYRYLIERTETFFSHEQSLAKV